MDRDDTTTRRESAVAAARAAWPGVRLDPERYAAHLARHAGEHVLTSELYLACACAEGDPVALQRFEETCLTDVDRAVAQLGFSVSDRDEVRQLVRELLFVRSGEREPHILRYAGRGTLRSWVRSVAVRTALRSRRGPRAVELDEEVFLEFAAATDDAELAPYKQRYRDEFRAAFSEAVAALTVRERNLLRQYFLEGLGIDQLGTMYRVHRATAARWVVDLRTPLQAGVRAALERRLELEASELTSLLGLVASQLELSLDRLL